jgi:dipeptidyl aminopeptidase/acylaminoacyl peptidase
MVAPQALADELPARPLVRYVPTAEDLRAGFQQSPRANQPRPRIYKDRIAPHWVDDNHRFWYRNDLRGASKEFIVVDVAQGKRDFAFDHVRLATALSKAAGKTFPGDRLPFDAIEFVQDGKAVRFQAEGAVWQVGLASYDCSRVGQAPKPVPSSPDQARPGKSSSPAGATGVEDSDSPAEFLALAEDRPPQQQRPPRWRRAEPPSPQSPDGQWTAFIKDHNLYLRSRHEGRETRLSQVGTEAQAYTLPHWAPDSQRLAAFRVEPGDRKEVYLVESSPREGGRARLHKRAYDLPGDKLTTYELALFQVDGFKQIKLGADRIDPELAQLHWSKDGSHVAYQRVDRGHQRFRLVEVDARTGECRSLIDETAQTFIWTAHTESVGVPRVSWLDKAPEIIYASERDGWRHLYLVDARAGKVRNQITRGEWVVRGIDRIDEDRRQVWFRASGVNKDQDPYLIHWYRIDFDGTNLVALTQGNGMHSVQFSPDHQYLIDTYSRVDCAPVHELRRATDGTLVCPLERADVAELEGAGWKPPEVFVAKGRDGKTDIWGIINRPRALDPSKKYPVIESIYAGPHGSYVPKSFMAFNRYAALTELGFIVVQIDGMGTANRSKAFHDVCWKDLKDAGFADRILWHQAVARKYPYYDLDRVGIYGTSAGGQNSTGALLFHPEFYRAAVSACGCHDNRMDKASWNEQWMGYPVGPQYADSSNITHAGKLRGKLLLIVGEMDTNVPPESTYRLVDVLVKAGKDFELLVVPGLGHSNGGAYGVRRMQDFFIRHLHGVQPPDRNGASAAVTAPPESFFAKVLDRDRDAARTFYSKYIDVDGLGIGASAEVADEALQRAAWLVTHLLAGRPDVLQAMVKHGTRLIIIGKDQVYTDMPEYRRHPNPAYQNERVRGTGGFEITSFGEENLLSLPLDRYDDESIAVHEFCHTIDAALRSIDPAWPERLLQTYRRAMSQGLWRNAYASSNPAEYWAEICQSYFDCNRINNWNHIAVGTREQLRLYDPEGYELVKTTFSLTPETDWRYQPLCRQPSVTAPPAGLRIDPYYTKLTYAREFIVLGSRHTSDAALLRANDIIRKMFAYRHDILKAMIADAARLIVLGRHEKLSDLPEFRGAGNRAAFDEVRYWDYTPSRKVMVVPEENVLGLAGEPFAGKCMVVSVLARGLYHVAGLRPVDPDFERRSDKQQYELRVRRLDVELDDRLQKLQALAEAKGLWKGTAAARSRAEYWAAGVEAYFDAAGDTPPPNLADRSISTREALRGYDPNLYALVDETMAFREHVDWRCRRWR